MAGNCGDAADGQGVPGQDYGNAYQMECATWQIDNETVRISFRLSEKRRWWQALHKDYRRDWQGYAYKPNSDASDERAKTALAQAIETFIGKHQHVTDTGHGTASETTDVALAVIHAGVAAVATLEGGGGSGTHCTCGNPASHEDVIRMCAGALGDLADALDGRAGAWETIHPCEALNEACDEACDDAADFLAGVVNPVG
jgi:hypothetical protein